MLDELKLWQMLEQQREKLLADFESSANRDLRYDEMMEEVQGLTEEEFEKKLGGSTSSARPVDWDNPLAFFDLPFESVRDAKGWALDQLEDTIVLAVDGSQVYPSKVLTFPLSLVQAGYFQMTYPPAFPAVSAELAFDSQLEIILPFDEDNISLPPKRGEINLRRQILEIKYATQQVESLPPEKEVLLLIDGTFIYSYLEGATLDVKKEVIAPLLNLFERCKELNIYPVAYIDTSAAKDMSYLLHQLNGVDKKIIPPQDAQILQPFMENLGTYCSPWLSQRKVLTAYHDETQDLNYREQVCFAYLRANSKRPIRLEFPKFIYDNEKFPRMVELVLAKALLGDGYPHVLTRAHQVAVIGSEDQRKFHAYSLVYLRDVLNLPVDEAIKEQFKHQFT